MLIVLRYGCTVNKSGFCATSQAIKSDDEVEIAITLKTIPEITSTPKKTPEITTTAQKTPEITTTPKTTAETTTHNRYFSLRFSYFVTPRSRNWFDAKRMCEEEGRILISNSN